MRIPTYAKTTVAAVCSVLMLSVPTVADDNNDSPGWWGGWGMHSMMGRGDRRGPGRGCMMGYGPNALLDRVDGRLAFLKTELKITDSQSEAWSSLAQTIRINSETHNAMHREMMKEMHDGDFFKKPLPDRLVIRETHLETRLQQVKNVKEEVEKLYAVLDDGQKKSADEIMLPMMGMGCGMGRGMMSN
jgi:Spy/CpxP family protein refolding chaperone